MRNKMEATEVEEIQDANLKTFNPSERSGGRYSVMYREGWEEHLTSLDVTAASGDALNHI